MAQPRIFVIGGEPDLAALSQAIATLTAALPAD
jgi:hypothetical protein